MKFLADLQKSIIKKNGMYMVYIIIFLISFIIPLPEYKMYLEAFRLIFAFFGFFGVLAVYFVFNKKRKPKEESAVRMTLGFFFILTSATAFTFFKNFL